MSYCYIKSIRIIIIGMVLLIDPWTQSKERARRKALSCPTEHNRETNGGPRQSLPLKWSHPTHSASPFCRAHAPVRKSSPIPVRLAQFIPLHGASPATCDVGRPRPACMDMHRPLTAPHPPSGKRLYWDQDCSRSRSSEFVVLQDPQRLRDMDIDLVGLQPLPVLLDQLLQRSCPPVRGNDKQRLVNPDLVHQ